MPANGAKNRKRGPDAFLDDPFAFPSDLSPVGKRGRCSPFAATVADLGINFPLEFDPIEALQLIFPEADPQDLRNCYEASGNDLYAAITAYKVHMENRSTESTSPPNNTPAEVDVPEVTGPNNVAEWSELIVKEMFSAPDLVDAKNRAFKILELFQKSTLQIGPDSKPIRDYNALKQMLLSQIHENGVLKRGVRILHNRLKNYEEMVQEHSQFKQTIENYQEQIKALESKNYFLSFHLQQANQRSSFSSHRNPDVF